MTSADTVLSGLEAALSRTSGTGRERDDVVASVTARIGLDDPCAAVFGSRLAKDDWFCWAEPDRDFQLAALGSIAQVTARGPRRFQDVDASCAEMMRGAVVERNDAADISGVGPVWLGGFGFDDDDGRSGEWSSFPPASMTLPELSVLRAAGETYVTLNARVSADATSHQEALAKAAKRLHSLASKPLPMIDPHPTVRTSITGRHSPEHFEDAVAQAVERIRRRPELEKVVLAREVQVLSGAAHDPAAVFGALREGFPSCFVFCRGTREGAFLGASPEVLVRRSGASAATVALAGSTRRSSDPAMDDHLGESLLRSEKDRAEQAIVTERVLRSLRPLSVWVESAPEPGVVKVANVQHLATPIAAQLAEAHTAIELAGRLHPTPAVGGEPWALAAPVLDELEQLDRGWYAGPVGWMDATGDGEFCVALRSALVRDRNAHLYAGVGVVEDSDPAEELAETELKLGALMPLFDQ